MSDARAQLLAHLETGCTTVCRAWAVTRCDGVAYGFTDHDQEFTFEGRVFKANTGMTARALQQTTGLSVDNSEAAGALSEAAIDEEDIAAGRFDGAQVRTWLVNWACPSQHIELFRGNFGEITRVGGAFKAELRGLTDRLNQPEGKVFQRSCSARLGDAACGFDVTTSGYAAEGLIAGIDAQGRLLIAELAGFSDGWFERGTLQVRSGSAQGLVGAVKSDRTDGALRRIGLWSRIGAGLAIGDAVHMIAGCDKRLQTCREKFDNFLNFRGFPHIPGEDWLASYPVRSRSNDGGSLGR